jgi:hypothetical protein
MKTSKKFIAGGLVAALFCAVVVVAILKSLEPKQEAAQLENKPKPVPVPQAEVKTATIEKAPVVAPSEAVPPEPMLATGPPKPVATRIPPVPTDETDYQMARDALALVGADQDAEDYWFDAISDPNLSDQQREDLMEDLNEEGLSDPKNPSADDLPLIVNRLRIIEETAPYADDFMLEHLGEAYKDLMNMYDRLTQN